MLIDQKHRNDFIDIIFHNNPDGIIIVDSDGNIHAWNKRSEELFELSEMEVIGRNLYEILSPENEQKLWVLGSLCELLITTKNQKEITIESSCVTITIENKDYIILNLRDIGERKKQEVSINAAKEKKHQASRLASVNLLAAGVAHEINNPLAIIQACIDRLTILSQNDELDKEKLKQSIEIQERIVKRISDIIEKLRALAHSDTLNQTELSLHTIINFTLGLSQDKFREHNITLETSMKASPDIFKGDHLKAHQILINLIDNAIDAVANSKDPQITITTKNSEDQIILEILDNGHGIDPDNKEFIFDNFFTTKPVGQGIGLGLSSTRVLVEEFGGDITFQTEVDKGTTFRISFPIQLKKQKKTLLF